MVMLEVINYVEYYGLEWCLIVFGCYECVIYCYFWNVL